MTVRSRDACHRQTLRGYRPEQQGRAEAEGRRELDAEPEQAPGFGGYYLIESENGVFTSFGLFDNSTQSEESTRVAANWVREQKLETIVPNAPKITSGEVVAQKLTNGSVQA
jgi:hypothetical protein